MIDEHLLIMDEEVKLIQLAYMYLGGEKIKVQVSSDGTSDMAEVDRLHPDLVVWPDSLVVGHPGD